MAENRPDPWILTYTRVHFPLHGPNPDLVNLEDIAQGLSNQCRFTGQIGSFYSIAQHSVMCAMQLPDEFKREGLLHDASEAYISDISRPLKSSYLMEGYKQIEEDLERAIAARFNLTFPYPPKVKEVDIRMYFTENRDLRDGPLVDPWVEGNPYEFKIVPWSPREAKSMFLAMADALGVK